MDEISSGLRAWLKLAFKRHWVPRRPDQTVSLPIALNGNVCMYSRNKATDIFPAGLDDVAVLVDGL